MSEAIQIIPSIVRWGRKCPGKIKKWGNGSMNSHTRGKPTSGQLLVAQALSFGWLNGKRISKRVRS